MLTPPRPQPTAAAADALDVDATRRAFLRKVAIGGAAAAVATQVLPLDRLVPRAGAQEEGDEGGGGDDETTDTTAPGSGTEGEEAVELTADEARMTFLAGVALAGAAAYRAAAGDDEPAPAGEEEGESGTDTPTTTTLPPIQVPPLSEPIVEVLRVFGSHHAQQATAINTTVPVEVLVPNSTLLTEVRDALGAAADEDEVLAVLRDLDDAIAASHQTAMGLLEDINDAKVVATALPVVTQHAVVLGLVGPTPVDLEELVPEEQTTDGALAPVLYPAAADPAPTDTPGATDDDANAGGEGADSGESPTPDDGTESSGGGADDGTDEGAGSAADPESEG